MSSRVRPDIALRRQRERAQRIARQDAATFSRACGHCKQPYDARASRHPFFCGDECSDAWADQTCQRAARAMEWYASERGITLDVAAFRGAQ